MKINRKYYIFVVFITLLISGCHKIDQKNEDNGNSKTMAELKVAPGFKWETTKTIEVKISAPNTGVIYINPVEGDFHYNKGFLTAGIDYTTKIIIPAHVKQVNLSFNGINCVVDLNGTMLQYKFK